MYGIDAGTTIVGLELCYDPTSETTSSSIVKCEKRRELDFDYFTGSLPGVEHHGFMMGIYKLSYKLPCPHACSCQVRRTV